MFFSNEPRWTLCSSFAQGDREASVTQSYVTSKSVPEDL